MIQRVWEQCKLSERLSDCIVATDDERILNHIIGFGGKAMLTSADHQSGTDRCAEVVSKLNNSFGTVINIQGDEPFIDPEQINKVVSLFDSPETQIGTLMKRISTQEEINNPNVVKVVRNVQGHAIYFSRSPIPYRRNPGFEITYYKHIGIYGYRTDILQEITRLAPGILEQAESLEQLRWIEAGYPVSLLETDLETLAIDTPADLEHVEKMMKS